jgi:hypothetical protein
VFGFTRQGELEAREIGDAEIDRVSVRGCLRLCDRRRRAAGPSYRDRHATDDERDDDD